MKTEAIREALLEFNDWVKTPAQGRLAAEAMEELSALERHDAQTDSLLVYAAWNAAIEAAAKACENMEAARNGWTGWPKCCAETIRALKREAK